MLLRFPNRNQQSDSSSRLATSVKRLPITPDDPGLPYTLPSWSSACCHWLTPSESLVSLFEAWQWCIIISVVNQLPRRSYTTAVRQNSKETDNWNYACDVCHGSAGLIWAQTFDVTWRGPAQTACKPDKDNKTLYVTIEARQAFTASTPLFSHLVIHPHVSRHHAILSGNHILRWRGPCRPRGICFHGDMTVVVWVTTLLLEEVCPQSWAGINLLSGHKTLHGTDKRRRFVVFIHRIPAVWSKQRRQTEANAPTELKQKSARDRWCCTAPLLSCSSLWQRIKLPDSQQARARTEATQQCSWQVVACQTW